MNNPIHMRIRPLSLCLIVSLLTIGLCAPSFGQMIRTPATHQPIVTGGMAHFNVNAQHNHLWGHDWPENDTVTIKLGDPAAEIGTAEVNEWGDFWFDSPEPIQPGDLLQVECGEIVKSHLVRHLAITAVDPENDTVSGTAAPETSVDVGVHDSYVQRHVQADEHGDWIADFSESVGEEPWDEAYNLTASSEFYIEQRDDEGDATFIHWRPPRFTVNAQHDGLWGHDWPANDTVTIKLGEPAEEIGTASVNEWGDFWFDSPEPIQPGDLLQVECGDIVKTHIVRDLAITAVDPENDTVSGTAEPEAWVDVGVHGSYVRRHVQADEHGDWIADFSESVGEEPWDDAYDLTAGSEVYAEQRDEDGDATSVHWRPPHFTVAPQFNNLWGHDWPANDTVTIKLGDPAAVIGTADVNEWGDFWFDSSVDIQPGDRVQAESGDIVKIHFVTELTVTAVDPENDTVSGTAAPETWVDVGVHDTDVRRHVEVDEHGDWIADFSESMGPDPWDQAYDITTGSGGYAEQRDEEGDATSVNWYVADPILRIELQHNNVRGQGWPPHATVEVTIGDPADPDYADTVHANHNGDWWLHIDDYDHRLQADDVVTADDGFYTRTITIPVLELTEVDSDNNLVSGIAPAETELAVRIGEVTLTTTADEHGEWQVDFSEEANIDDGTEGWLYLEDEHGNIAETFWRYATLDIEDIELVKYSFPEEGTHAFELIIVADGLLSARFQAPSGDWYDLFEDWDEWLFWTSADSRAAIDAEFTPGEYQVELSHYHGTDTIILEYPEHVEKPNATPVIISPAIPQSDVDPMNAVLEWEMVDEPNFEFIFRFIEDEIFYEFEDGWGLLQFDPAEEDMPTQDLLPELQANRLYLSGVGFANSHEDVSSGDIEVEYVVNDVIFGMTTFSTKTDEELFDPIDLILIDRGRWGDGDYSFVFEVELSEPLQIPGETPLYHRLMVWTPEDEYYTLFDATRQNEFGDVVELDLYDEDLDALPGPGWYALVVQKDDASAVATWFLFAEAESEAPLPMPEQLPVITQPQADSVVANPVTFAWEPVTDEAVNGIGVFHAPDEFVMLGDEATEYSPPEDLPVGLQHVLVIFGERHINLLNADSIQYEISQYIVNGLDFTVGYTLTYEAGDGGLLEGPVEQVVAPDAIGDPVTALAEDGALFWKWDDGDVRAERTDENVQGDGNFTALFQSAGGVAIDWYVDHNIEREGEEDWSDLDQRYDPDKRMTLSQQYIADLDPTAPTSIFRILGIEPGPPLTVHFEPSSTGRVYSIEFTDDLGTPDWTHVLDADPRPGSGGDDSFEDTDAPPMRLYRIQVELP